MTSMHQKYFPYFFNLMLEEMDRHQLEYGDSWVFQDLIHVDPGTAIVTDSSNENKETITMECYLDRLLSAAVLDYEENWDPTQLEDIGNICAMRRIRGTIKKCKGSVL